MIPKNLKVGDTFIDEGRKYRVKALCSVGYISESVDIPEKVKESVKEEPKVEEPKEETKIEYSKTQINRLPLEELKKVCVEVGIEPMETGTAMKKALIEKLGL